MNRFLARTGLYSRMPQKFACPVAVLTLIVALVIGGCGKKEEPAPKEVVRPVKVLSVQSGGGGQSMTFPGKTRANRRVDLSFKVPGPLVELPVEEG